MKKVIVAFGTRPEIIKLAPVIRALKKEGADVGVLFTGQHTDLAATVRGLIPGGIDRRYYVANTSPRSQIAEILRNGLTADCVVVQGDTTSAFGVALAAFYQRIPVAHVEAGLRSQDINQPWPEEGHRTMIDCISTYLYAPTNAARGHLLDMRHGTYGVTGSVVQPEIRVVGNTAIDTLLLTHREHKLIATPTRVLVTLHRRELIENPNQKVHETVNELALTHPNIEFIYMDHPNPMAQRAAKRHFSSPNIVKRKPVGYASFIDLMVTCKVILTDSGGIVEEAPTLGVRTVILRNTTERPEAVACGAACMGGTDPEQIKYGFEWAMSHPERYTGQNPFGDGHAGERIAKHLMEHLNGVHGDNRSACGSGEPAPHSGCATHTGSPSD